MARLSWQDRTDCATAGVLAGVAASRGMVSLWSAMAVVIPYRRFLVFNAVGGITWGVAVVTLGYLAGASYAQVEHSFGRYAAFTVAGIVVLAVGVLQPAARQEKTCPPSPTRMRCVLGDGFR